MSVPSSTTSSALCICCASTNGCLRDKSFGPGDAVMCRTFKFKSAIPHSTRYGVITDSGFYHPYHKATYWGFDSFGARSSAAVSELTKLTGDEARVIMEIHRANQAAMLDGSYRSNVWGWFQAQPPIQWCQDWDAQTANVPAFLRKNHNVAAATKPTKPTADATTTQAD